MKAIWILALAAIVSVGLSAGELAGTWKGSMQTQAGQADVTLRIEPGAQLKGYRSGRRIRRRDRERQGRWQQDLLRDRHRRRKACVLRNG